MPRKSKTKYKMPKWIWNVAPGILNWQQKYFLSFIWSCDDTGLRSWNYYIAQKYHVSPRTIRRWITRLRRLDFIYVNYPSTTHRTIYRRRFFHIDDYYKFRAKKAPVLGRT